MLLKLQFILIISFFYSIYQFLKNEKKTKNFYLTIFKSIEIFFSPFIFSNGLVSNNAHAHFEFCQLK